jgi:hypothetical protein
MWFIMSTKIQRYDTVTYGPVVEFDPYDDGEYVMVYQLVDFAKQFPKNSDVRCELLDALGVVDED